MSLERKLIESNEQEILALQNVKLHSSELVYKGKLEKMEGITQEHISHLASTIISKTDEILHLQTMILTKVEEETEVFKVQVSVITYTGRFFSRDTNFADSEAILCTKFLIRKKVVGVVNVYKVSVTQSLSAAKY